MPIKNLLFYILIFSVFLSCSGNSAPSITGIPTGQYRNGEIVWRELVTPDAKVAADFYTKLFGWRITKSGEGKNAYWLISQGDKPIGGIVAMPPTVRNATGEWLCSISVADVEALVNSGVSKGASILMKPTEMSGRGKTAVLKDPQGAPYGLIHALGGDPVKQAPEDNNWLWTELWSQNMAGSIQFYTEAFGISMERKQDDNREYILLKNKNQEVAGIIASPVQNVRSHWVNYIKVADPAAMVRKARELGAKIILEPSAAVRNASLGVFLDPTGAPIAVQKYPIK